VKDLHHNVLSISQVALNGNIVIIDNNTAYIMKSSYSPVLKQREIKMEAKLIEGLYRASVDEFVSAFHIKSDDENESEESDEDAAESEED
jgi:hypothetical protein